MVASNLDDELDPTIMGSIVHHEMDSTILGSSLDDLNEGMDGGLMDTMFRDQEDLVNIHSQVNNHENNLIEFPEKSNTVNT